MEIHSSDQQSEVMMNKQIMAVTISHQLGSGGAYIGERLAARLGIPFGS
jgi:hypothetical protein